MSVKSWKQISEQKKDVPKPSFRQKFQILDKVKKFWFKNFLELFKILKESVSFSLLISPLIGVALFFYMPLNWFTKKYYNISE